MVSEAGTFCDFVRRSHEIHPYVETQRSPRPPRTSRRTSQYWLIAPSQEGADKDLSKGKSWNDDHDMKSPCKPNLPVRLLMRWILGMESLRWSLRSSRPLRFKQPAVATPADLRSRLALRTRCPTLNCDALWSPLWPFVFFVFQKSAPR